MKLKISVVSGSFSRNDLNLLAINLDMNALNLEDLREEINEIVHTVVTELLVLRGKLFGRNRINNYIVYRY